MFFCVCMVFSHSHFLLCILNYCWWCPPFPSYFNITDDFYLSHHLIGFLWTAWPNLKNWIVLRKNLIRKKSIFNRENGRPHSKTYVMWSRLLILLNISISKKDGVFQLRCHLSLVLSSSLGWGQFWGREGSDRDADSSEMASTVLYTYSTVVQS